VRLRDKVALVTGGASGIGLATASAFAREGARVIVLDRENGASVEALLQPPASEPLFQLGDVSREEDVGRAFSMIEDRFGGLDILYNNAGIDMVGALEQVEPQDFDRAFAVNVRGAYLATRLAIPLLRARGGGVILMNASNAGLVARAHDPVYCATKAALVMLTRSLALSLACDRIRVNAICPGPVDTPAVRRDAGDGGWEAHESRLLASAPLGRALGRIASAEEVADAAVFLASDEASYVTGIALPVDGGKTAGLQVFD
jgi:NAD(P)-dependent dehydrogenase (short-subunit alcohol dehydrogenase family)